MAKDICYAQKYQSQECEETKWIKYRALIEKDGKQSIATPCYVASFRDSVQISPDDFKLIRHTKICTPKTTLKDIHDWAKKKTKYVDLQLHCEISEAT